MIMLVKFAIDPDALGCAESDAFYRFYRNWWTAYGVLADPQGSGSALAYRKYRDELQNAYKSFDSNGWPLFCETRPIDWQSMQSPSDLTKYSDEFSLALLEDTRALVFGVPDGNGGKFSKNCGGVEAARFQHADLSTNFESATLLSDQAIHKGQNTADLWRERFQNLVRCSNSKRLQQITIVDRYIASNILDGKTELFRLLEHISADSPGCGVTIFSSDSRVSNLDYVKERIDSNLERIGLRKDGINRLTMFICYDDVFGGSAHGRYVRFDGITYTIDIGIEIFRDDVVGRRSDFSIKSYKHIETYRKCERELRNGKRFPHWRWPPS